MANEREEEVGPSTRPEENGRLEDAAEDEEAPAAVKRKSRESRKRSSGASIKVLNENTYPLS